MSSLKNARSVWDSLSDDYSTRRFTGWTRCPVHNRVVPLDVRRKVGFCGRCQREFHVWEISPEAPKVKTAKA